MGHDDLNEDGNPPALTISARRRETLTCAASLAASLARMCEDIQETTIAARFWAAHSDVSDILEFESALERGENWRRRGSNGARPRD